MTDESSVELRFLRECPKLMGVDYERYGPFEKDDEAEIPEDNAEILLDQGVAERMGDD